MALWHSAPIAQARHLTAAEALDIISPTATSLGMPHNEAAPDLVYSVAAQSATLPGVYVFNRPGDKGFLVVAADDGVDNMLLGYSTNGKFDAATANESMLWWLQKYASEVDIAANTPPAPVKIKTAVAERADIAPMLTTKWNQDSPYNDLCPYPVGGDTRCPTGCVATAMAQVMNYHEWPDKGTGHHSYICKNVEQQLSCDFSSTTFAWSDMADDYDKVTTDEQKQAVATLMYAVGVSIDMNYGPRGSGSNYFEGASAMVKYFDYDKGLQILERQYYPLDQWMQVIYDELSAGRPVLYGGQNSEDGHAFVFDGYASGDYVHVNWGWGGVSNGYFLVTALDPSTQGIGGSSAGYNLEQDMIIGIQRPVEGSKIVPTVRFINGFGVAASVVARNSNVVVTDSHGIFNGSTGEITITPGLKLVDATGGAQYVEGVQSYDLIMNEGFRSYSVAVSALPTEGVYTVSPAFCCDGQWYDMLVVMSGVRSLKMTATETGVEFGEPTEPTLTATDVKLNTSIVSGYEFSVGVTLTADGGEYYGEISPVITVDGSLVESATSIAVDVFPAEPQRCEWIASLGGSIQAGEYTLYIVDKAGHAISDGVTVEVESDPGTTPEALGQVVAVKGPRTGSGTEQDPYLVDFSNFKATISVEGEEGYFAQMISGHVLADPNTRVRTINGGFVGLHPGESANVEICDDLSALSHTHTYLLCPWSSVAGQIGDPVYIVDASSALAGRESDLAKGLAVSVDNGDMAITVTAAEALAEVSLYAIDGDMVGHVVVDRQKNATLSTANLSRGVYVVSATFASGEVSSEKVAL